VALSAAPSIDDLKLDLMASPSKLERTQSNKSYLFAPFSPKNQRRLACEGVARYQVCTLLEGDPTVRAFSEKATGLSIPAGPGKNIAITSLAASRREGMVVTVHLFDYADLAASQGVDALAAHDAGAAWAKRYGIDLRFWTQSELTGLRLKIANLGLILRYVSIPGLPVDMHLRHRIEETLHAGPLSVADIISACGEANADAVMPALADLILQERVTAAIDSKQFNFQSLVSVNGR
jgi:hypothetical protein